MTHERSHYSMLLASTLTVVGFGPYAVVRFDEDDCVPSFFHSFEEANQEMTALKAEGVRSAMFTVEKLSDDC